MNLRKYLLVCFVSTLILFLASLNFVQLKSYRSRMHQTAVGLKKEFTKDSVCNLISDIDATVKDSKKVFTFTINDTEKNLFLKIGNRTPSDAFLKSFFAEMSTEFPQMWGYFYFNRETSKLNSSLNARTVWDGDEDLLPYVFAVWRKIDFPGNTLYFGITKKHFDTTLESIYRKRLHEIRFADNNYFWINRIEKYSGGRNYAVCLINPNPAYVEGGYISTDMTDLKGNKPFAIELSELTRKGEAFNSYYLRRIDSPTASLKISYSKLYEPLDWVVGMGIYEEDVDKVVSQVSKNSFLSAPSYSIPIAFVWLLVIMLVLLVQVALEQHKSAVKHDGKVGESNWDGLTGAGKRQFAVAQLEHTFSNFKNNIPSPAIVFFDVDNFRYVNEVFGRETGDYVLKEIIKVIKANSRVSDIVFRWAGDEFLLILDGMKIDYCEVYAQKMLTSVSNMEISYGGQMIFVTISAGVTYFSEKDDTFYATLRRADDALALAKKNGKNQIVARLPEEMER